MTQITYDPKLEDMDLVTAETILEIQRLAKHGHWESSKPIYIFDMDGTICNSLHRHHYLQSVDAEGNVVPRPGGKDWDSFFAAQKDDVPYEAITGIMAALKSELNIVLILTARPQSQYEESVRWLDEHSVAYDGIFMRPDNCRLDDNLLKPKQLHTYLSDHVSRVRTIFEDRRRIVDSLRHHGFHVCHVAEGDF